MSQKDKNMFVPPMYKRDREKIRWSEREGKSAPDENIKAGEKEYFFERARQSVTRFDDVLGAKSRLARSARRWLGEGLCACGEK